MIRIRERASFLVAGWLVAASLSATDASSALIGRWRSLENSKGSVGAVFHFGNGGALEYSPAAVVEMPYRLDGDVLTLPPDTQEGPENKQTIEWVGADKIRLRASPEVSVELVRKGRPGDAPHSILGEWASSREVSGKQVEALYFFYPGGKALLLIPFLPSQGSYTVEGEKIHFSVPKRWTADGSFRVTGDTLVLSITDSKGSRESRYARY